MEQLEGVRFGPGEVRTSWLYTPGEEDQHPGRRSISRPGPSTARCCAARDQPLIFMEDVGRHNAVDKIAGWMFREGVDGAGHILYTTGRLTSEMVIKTALMGIPVLASRSGFTAWGVELARQVGLTLIGRMRGQRFHCLSGEERLVFDTDLTSVPEEDRKHRRKGAAG